MNETIESPITKRSVSVALEEPPKRGRDTLLERVQKLLAEKCVGKVAIFTHPFPDPDAIGSQMALAWLITKAYECEVDCYFDGHVSHPQNQRICNLLDPDLKVYSKYDPKEYALNILVDTVPIHASCPEGTSFDLVIDHHKEVPNGGFKGLFLNLKAGSACATVYQIIKQHGLHFEEDNVHDSKVATALLVGIVTDTDYQTSDDTTDYEHEAYQALFGFRNSEALKKITKYKLPAEWVKARACVAMKAHDHIKEGVLVHGLGFLNGNNRDLLAAIADEILSWENVETSVVFAVVDGDRIEGSVRSTNAAIAVPMLCKELGGQYGGGGGKLGKGAYFYNLGSLSCEGDMDEATKTKMWEFIEDKERKRITKLVKK
jgi:nanoRNase/pAp phosphatase (c-di-AMP/oligoRNAs hydrolase)